MELIEIGKLKLNPDNPRLIKDEKFQKLVQSLKDFPEMTKVRPIVANTELIVLGGNMRLRAMQEAGWKTVPVEIVDWDEEKQKEFTIKDNIGFGEWDWELIANDWNTDKLTEWGMDIFWNGIENNLLNENDLNITESFDPIGKASGLQRVVFIFDGKEEAESYLKNLGIKYEKRNMAWQVNLSSLYTS